MSEMIGPEGGESGEKTADWRGGEQSNRQQVNKQPGHTATGRATAAKLGLLNHGYLQGEGTTVLGHGVGGAGVVQHQRTVERGNG